MTETSPGDSFTAALTDELSRKTAVCWLRFGGEDHPVWHIWYDGALHVVSGGDEQPLPGIGDVSTVEVVMRSKANGGRLLTWVGEVSVVRPEDQAWEPVTTALVAARLNLDDLAAAAADWAERSVVARIDPTDRTAEAPGSTSDDAHRAVPKPTPATTRGPLPKVLHRRGNRRPNLS